MYAWMMTPGKARMKAWPKTLLKTCQLTWLALS
jgi:hypothetical protein